MTIFSREDLDRKSLDKPWGYKRDILKSAQVSGDMLVLSEKDFQRLRSKYGNRTSFRFKAHSFWRHLSNNVRLFFLYHKIIAKNEVRKGRYDICQSCPELNKGGFCNVCGCNMALKTKLIYAKCPLDKWN